MKRLPLNPSITADGQVELAWASEDNLAWVAVLVMRTGAVPAYTAFHLDGATRRFGFSSLSRHQRYRMAIIGQKEDGDLATGGDESPRGKPTPHRRTRHGPDRKPAAHAARRSTDLVVVFGPGLCRPNEARTPPGGAFGFVSRA
ncbi:MAG: hypothetical protein JRF33_18780 [Deltaproteobacteria bacterium]|nr:hypothetical protein [Deltaproteobacteria bacterium]